MINRFKTALFSTIVLIIVMIVSLTGCSNERFNGDIITNQEDFNIEDYQAEEGVKALELQMPCTYLLG